MLKHFSPHTCADILTSTRTEYAKLLNYHAQDFRVSFDTKTALIHSQRFLPHPASLRPIKANGSWDLLQGDPSPGAEGTSLIPSVQSQNLHWLHTAVGHGWKICFKRSTIITKLNNSFLTSITSRHLKEVECRRA